MKLKISKQAKHLLTMEDADGIPAVQASFVENKNFNDEAASMVYLMTGRAPEMLLSVDHSIWRNDRNEYEFFGEGTGHLDVKITAIALIDEYVSGFVIVEGYISDIWQIGPEDRKDELRGRMYMKTYKPST